MTLTTASYYRTRWESQAWKKETHLLLSAWPGGTRVQLGGESTGETFCDASSNILRKP